MKRDLLRNIAFTVLLGALCAGCDRKNEPASGRTDGQVTVPAPSASPQQTTAAGAPMDEAEALYQELLAKHQADYTPCLQPVEIKLKELQFPQGEPTATPTPQLNVVIALDASGSMAERVGGEQKMALARVAVERFVGTLPPGANVSLVVYGHKGSNRAADKAASCAGVEQVYPLSALDAARFGQAVGALQPTGFTPVAGALAQSGAVLAVRTGANERNLVYLVSDGIETCGGDPVAAARTLHTSNTRAVVNIIGFDVDNAAQRQLQRAAEAGGGEFFLAKNGAELNQGFQRLHEAVGKYVASVSNNLANRNEVTSTLHAAGNELFSCMSQKTHQEFSDLSNAVFSLRSDDPRRRLAREVREKVIARRDEMYVWRNELRAGLMARKHEEVAKLLERRAEIKAEFQRERGR